MEKTSLILYGVADYAQMRENNEFFIDHTAKVRNPEKNATSLKPRRFSKFLLLPILLVMLTHHAVGDVAMPDPEYRAVSYSEWKKETEREVRPFVDLRSVQEVEIVILFLVCACAIASIVVDGWKRRYKMLLIWLSVELLVAGVLMWSIWYIEQCLVRQDNGSRNRTLRFAQGGDIEYVEPKQSESYEVYLGRVDRLKRHVCLECNTQKQKLSSQDFWHCPKCEPYYFVCAKCGGAKEAMGRGVGCPRCDQGKKWIITGDKTETYE